MRARNYELMYIIDPTVGNDDQYTAIADRVQGYITNTGATPTNGEALAPSGRRKLAYAIRHNGQDLTEGFYVFTRFEAQPQQIRVLERDLKLTEQIVRYLLTVVE
jgi:small subunit ribosomal protein S6